MINCIFVHWKKKLTLVRKMFSDDKKNIDKTSTAHGRNHIFLAIKYLTLNSIPTQSRHDQRIGNDWPNAL